MPLKRARGASHPQGLWLPGAAEGLARTPACLLVPRCAGLLSPIRAPGAGRPGLRGEITVPCPEGRTAQWQESRVNT